MPTFAAPARRHLPAAGGLSAFHLRPQSLRRTSSSLAYLKATSGLKTASLPSESFSSALRFIMSVTFA